MKWFESVGEYMFDNCNVVYLFCFGLIFVLLFIQYIMNMMGDDDMIEVMERLEEIEKKLNIYVSEDDKKEEE